MAKRIDLIVIEDEEIICREYENLCKDNPDIYFIGSTGKAHDALQMCKEFNPTSIVLDLELNKGGGNGIHFLEEFATLNLPRRPYILVVTNNVSPVTHNTIRQLGADFIITKNQSDYSVSMVLGLLMSINKAGGSLDTDSNECNTKLTQANEYRETLKNRISTELDLIGISSHLKGRKYLRDAIELTCDKERPNLCAIIAKTYQKTDASVERAMQTAINRAWRITDTETLEKQYTAYINPRRGVPTITEFIYYYADKVKKNI